MKGRLQLAKVMKQMTMPEKFDVIIVGAGLAGTTAALVLARAGFKVALFERGEEPGSKNMSGGVLYYSEVLNDLVPNFWNEAPIERYITKHSIYFDASPSSVSFSFKNDEFSEPPYNGFTVLRAKFDRWYAEKAQQAGAFLIPETVVDDLVWENGKVIGIKARREDGIVYSDAVIAADGANSLLAQKAGLRDEFHSSSFAVAAKELLALPAEVIEERFCLQGNEGVAKTFVGACTQGLEGGAFLYTNKASISLGIVANLSSLQQRGISIADLLDGFKNNSYVKKAIKDAILKEYSGHLIPEAGIKMLPGLYGNGILIVGDAAGLLLSTGIYLEGMHFAIASGFAAAKAIQNAQKKGDFSRRTLAVYEKLLKESFVLKDLETFRRAPYLLRNNNIYTTYPSLICGVGRRVFQVNNKPRRKILALVREEIKGKVSMWRLIKDLIQTIRALIW